MTEPHVDAITLDILTKKLEQRARDRDRERRWREANPEKVAAHRETARPRALEYLREYNATRRDPIREQERKRARRADPVEKVEQARRGAEWKRANGDRVRELERARYARNAEDRRAYDRAWRAANRDRVNQKKRENRARKKAAALT